MHRESESPSQNKQDLCLQPLSTLGSMQCICCKPTADEISWGVWLFRGAGLLLPFGSVCLGSPAKRKASEQRCLWLDVAQDPVRLQEDTAVFWEEGCLGIQLALGAVEGLKPSPAVLPNQSGLPVITN